MNKCIKISVNRKYPQRCTRHPVTTQKPIEIHWGLINYKSERSIRKWKCINLLESERQKIYLGGFLINSDLAHFKFSVYNLDEGVALQFNKINYKSENMGLECTKVPQKPAGMHDTISLENVGAELRDIQGEATFNIKINNLRFLNFSQTFHLIKIEIPGDMLITISSKDFQKQDKVWISYSQYIAEIKIPVHQIATRLVSISIIDKLGNIIDQLKMKFYHLATGPIKHDHLLKELKARLLFDFQVDQHLDIQVLLNSFQFNWERPENYEGQSFFLSLIFSNTKNHIQATKKFEKHEKIKAWGLETWKIRNSQLADSIIKLKLVSCQNVENQFQFYIPYAKLVQQIGFKQIKNQFGCFEIRQLAVNQLITIRDETIGTIDLKLQFKKQKLFVEQMECMIFSQKGIVMTTVSQYEGKSKKIDWKKMVVFFQRLKNSQAYGISDYEFYKLMEDIYSCILDKEFSIMDNLFQIQQALLDFLIQLSDYFETDKQIKNEYIWNILDQVLHKEILNLKYFSSIESEALKIRIAKKFYHLIINIICKVIASIATRISYKEMVAIQKFIAYVYFKFPWCQQQIIKALSRPNDPILSEEKLAEIGASSALKSPSKSYFYDWEANVLRLIRRDEQFLKMMSKLQQMHNQNPRWAELLFHRQYEQLFYGLYFQIWDEAEIVLNNNGRIMWSYFPQYGQLLCILFGQMNSNSITDFSPSMTKCNMKLIKNQKLLNMFMMLIFPKTCLYQTYCVIKCLDLINCYFLVILNNNKKMPHDFHYNYFYTGIRCILQSNHSYLVQKMLAIIYQYYNIFTNQFKETLNHYIINKVFNQLFMHWSQDVRIIFHLLLIFRISKYEQAENPEICFKKIKQGHEFLAHKENYQCIVENLYHLKAQRVDEKENKSTSKLQLYEQMKQKLKKKMIHRQRQSQWDHENQNFSATFSPRNMSLAMFIPPNVRRKWSLADNLPETRSYPSESELKYLAISLKEFQLAKKEENPDKKVEQRSKMLQMLIDE